MLLPKEPMVRDRAYLDYLRTAPCLFTGIVGQCEPVHVGTGGKGYKYHDDCAIPLHYQFHRNGHQSGEASMLRDHMPADVVRDALRMYGRHILYEGWVKEGRPAEYRPLFRR
jgi:hypothetical protein